jgi:hypothetical protein
MSYDSLRLDNMKPISMAHEIQTDFNRKTQQLVARSQRFSNRIMPGASVSVRLRFYGRICNISDSFCLESQGHGRPWLLYVYGYR